MAQEKQMRWRHVRMLARRFGIGGSTRVVACCVVVLLLFGGVGFLRMSGSQTVAIERGEDARAAAPEEQAAVEPLPGEASVVAEVPPTIVVHVDGAVNSPGVYELSGSVARINDAIALAGGLTSEADTSTINLAAQLGDGQKVHVPRAGEVVESVSVDTSSSAEPAASLININTATEQELQQLSGVGESTASAIVEDREANGPFASPEDLMRVSGIGEKKFAKMKEKICV